MLNARRIDMMNENRGEGLGVADDVVVDDRCIEVEYRFDVLLLLRCCVMGTDSPLPFSLLLLL